jgi:hypothetical protein
MFFPTVVIKAKTLQTLKSIQIIHFFFSSIFRKYLTQVPQFRHFSSGCTPSGEVKPLAQPYGTDQPLIASIPLPVLPNILLQW